ncbi:GNAT family N-acetyltransferase [Phyllobacterium sp. 22229]|nr:GNAT family N-acetyltransferase [Phyllobacterium myrsinacearum]RZS76676.1 N-acetylglutamate synthase-like GNAT family acetyltransferase [Phyllobacterium myrsinacearum]
MLKIRPAERGDAKALTQLMHRSSAYHGNYASILDGYAITADQIDADVFYIADLQDDIAGFYSLALDDEPELDLMFVADHAQGSGIGAKLFQHMAAEAKRRGIPSIKIISHPPSVGFYQKMGATIVGTKPPTLKVTWARPILNLAIQPSGWIEDA